ncbi:hypothetical protein A0J61_01714 [Choanephora cucurbitarum]|uniref:Uncharacterized protein n=1 Tax=Choanephora cucurbitarum TaxID=101091 RepID=A0A1C7NMR3_9FUNG|nr:hypothetical protein A0J61_01714 [Choanephora cucurbitarum]
MLSFFKTILSQPKVAFRAIGSETILGAHSLSLNRSYVSHAPTTTKILLEQKIQLTSPQARPRQNFGRWTLLESDLFHLKIASLGLPFEKIKYEHLCKIAAEMGTRDVIQCKRYFIYHYIVRLI